MQTRRARVDTPRREPPADGPPAPALDRLDADELAAVGDDAEDHLAGDLREEGAVPSHADVRPRVVDGAVLAHEDAPRADRLAAEALHAEALPLAVAAVAGTALSFFVSHRPISLLDGDPADLHAG